MLFYLSLVLLANLLALPLVKEALCAKGANAEGGVQGGRAPHPLGSIERYHKGLFKRPIRDPSKIYPQPSGSSLGSLEMLQTSLRKALLIGPFEKREKQNKYKLVKGFQKALAWALARALARAQNSIFLALVKNKQNTETISFLGQGSACKLGASILRAVYGP